MQSNVPLVGYGQSYLDRITSAGRAEHGSMHPNHDKMCPTCDEIPRLQRYCPDCRSRARMHPNQFRYVYEGPASGNEALWYMAQERQQIDNEKRMKYIESRQMECPSCDKVDFIPEDDYLCQGCRSDSGL